jgi:large subunit ribosomal protein L35
MPKMKSKGAVKGRFRVTKTGRVVCSRPGRGHMHASKSAKQIRKLRSPIILPPTWGKAMKKMMGA